MIQELQKLLEVKNKASCHVSVPYSTGKEDYVKCTKHQIMMQELEELLKKNKDSGHITLQYSTGMEDND